MHIILANQWYPSENGSGGVGIYNRVLARYLVKKGHQVTVVATRWNRSQPYEQTDRGVKIYRLLTGYPSFFRRLPLVGQYVSSIQKALYSEQLSAFLVKLNKIQPFDIIEFAEICGEGAAYLRRVIRAPVVVRCHTPTFVLNQYALQKKSYSTSWTERMEEFSIRKADLLTAPSQDMAKEIRKNKHLANMNIQVIPNPLDLEEFFPKPSNQNDNKRIIDILHVGRFDPIKGINVLVNAMPVVIRKIPEARFVFLGHGENYMEKIIPDLKTNGIPEKVLFRSDVGQNDLLEAYHTADIAVVPTLNYESFSYTVAQAMACGLPVVASRIGGIPETVGDEEAAILVEPGNVEQLADALIDLCRHPDRRHRMGAAARHRAETYFSDAVVTPQIVKFYQTIFEK